MAHTDWQWVFMHRDEIININESSGLHIFCFDRESLVFGALFLLILMRLIAMHVRFDARFVDVEEYVISDPLSGAPVRSAVCALVMRTEYKVKIPVLASYYCDLAPLRPCLISELTVAVLV